ncbi:MAG: low molecular weight phosphotyrosine protein phosphatase [Ruthenibacterium lactatiformans]
MAENVAWGFVHAASAATSGEELGNPVHQHTESCGLWAFPARIRAVRLPRRLQGLGPAGHGFVQFVQHAAYFYGDPERRMFCRWITRHPRDIADPWYTGDFDATYADVCEGCGALLEHLLRGGLRPE